MIPLILIHLKFLLKSKNQKRVKRNNLWRKRNPSLKNLNLKLCKCPSSHI